MRTKHDIQKALTILRMFKDYLHEDAKIDTAEDRIRLAQMLFPCVCTIDVLEWIIGKPGTQLQGFLDKIQEQIDRRERELDDRHWRN